MKIFYFYFNRLIGCAGIYQRNTDFARSEGGRIRFQTRAVSRGGCYESVAQEFFEEIHVIERRTPQQDVYAEAFCWSI
jgi:hypothetical protein